MSAFGIIMAGLGILMMWAGIKKQKVNVILHSFYNATPVKK